MYCSVTTEAVAPCRVRRGQALPKQDCRSMTTRKQNLSATVVPHPTRAAESLSLQSYKWLTRNSTSIFSAGNVRNTFLQF